MTREVADTVHEGVDAAAGVGHRGPWDPKEHEEGSQKHRPPDDGEGTCLAEYRGGPGDPGARGRL